MKSMPTGVARAAVIFRTVRGIDVPTDVIVALAGNGHLSGTIELTGTSDCVVYVHSFGSARDGAKATALQSACAGRGFSYAAFDFRGHGRSSGIMRDLRASGLLSDLEAVRDFLTSKGVTKLFPVGSSMGGFASSWFALRHPELVPAVVLMAPAFNFLQRRWHRLGEERRRAW